MIHARSLPEAIAFYRAHKDVVTAIVSLGDVGPTPPYVLRAADEGKSVLRLEFCDVESGRDVGAPTRAQIEQLVFFLREVLAQPSPLVLIQCFAGKSRSTAAAYAAWRILGEEHDDAMLLVKRDRDIADPNLLMVEFINDALARRR